MIPVLHAEPHQTSEAVLQEVLTGSSVTSKGNSATDPTTELAGGWYATPLKKIRGLVNWDDDFPNKYTQIQMYIYIYIIWKNHEKSSSHVPNHQPDCLFAATLVPCRGLTPVHLDSSLANIIAEAGHSWAAASMAFRSFFSGGRRSLQILRDSDGFCDD